MHYPNPEKMREISKRIESEIKQQNEARGVLSPDKEKQRFLMAWLDIVTDVYDMGYQDGQNDKSEV